MADKGFNVADLLDIRGMKLNIPPRKNGDQFTESELLETRRIAINIERAIGHVSNFQILNLMPNNLATLCSEIFYVCTFLTFHPLLLKETP